MMAMQQLPEVRGELRFDEPMSKHTSFRVGGPARCYFQPADRDDLIAFLSTLGADEQVFWLGLGSNLLVRDGGLDATVISLQGRVNDLAALEGNRYYAEAGATCAKVARNCARLGLQGSTFLSGIPGLIGGALAMNAGAYGGETWEYVESVETVDRQGHTHQRTRDEYEIAYRSVSGPTDEWFLSATFQFESGDVSELQDKIRSLLKKRSESQPTSKPTCGSVFRNPAGDHAARLIESAGLKGYRIGGAQVSTKHANFIENTGDASASDIESLIAHVQQKVVSDAGIQLQPEVHVVGEARA